MRVVFYARPWSVELLSAIEDHWTQAGLGVECRYITHQLQAARKLRASGVSVTLIPEVIRRLDIAEPVRELARIEARYGDALLPIARYLMAERYFRRRPRAWQLEQATRHAVFFERLFEEFAPDLLVGESPDIMPAWLAYDMAPAHGCEPIGMIPSTLPPGRLLMLRGHNEIAGAREAYERLRAEGMSPQQEAAARGLQEVVLGEGTRLDYLPPSRDYLDFARRLASGRILRAHLASSVWQLRERAIGNWFVQPDPILHRLLQPARALRAAVADARYLSDERSGRPFVFYPLHYEPEATTLVHGSYFEDQLTVVRNLARSLPAGWDLVVKEHFYMRGWRHLGFYRALRRIPNLRLLPFATPTNELIKQAQGVAVIASTVGLEASVIGKPVLMFGEYPWDHAPTVRRLGALRELPSQLRSLPGAELGPDHPDVLAFAASWDASLPEGRYFKTRNYDWREPENVHRIAAALAGRAPQRARSEAEALEAAI